METRKDWNEPLCSCGFSSYPTYEEWKHLSAFFNLQMFYCSYPTYEEWKQANVNIGMNNTFSSYPTYEEWKLRQQIHRYIH